MKEYLQSTRCYTEVLTNRKSSSNKIIPTHNSGADPGAKLCAMEMEVAARRRKSSCEFVARCPRFFDIPTLDIIIHVVVLLAPLLKSTGRYILIYCYCPSPLPPFDHVHLHLIQIMKREWAKTEF